MAAELIHAGAPELGDEVAFHCQQSIEKSLKGFLFWHNKPFQKTHNLVVLSNECISIDSTLESLLKKTAPLNQFAVGYRYPGQEIHPSTEEIESMIALAKEIYDAIIKRIPSEVRPD